MCPSKNRSQSHISLLPNNISASPCPSCPSAFLTSPLHPTISLPWHFSPPITLSAVISIPHFLFGPTALTPVISGPLSSCISPWGVINYPAGHGHPWNRRGTMCSLTQPLSHEAGGGGSKKWKSTFYDFIFSLNTIKVILQYYTAIWTPLWVIWDISDADHTLIKSQRWYSKTDHCKICNFQFQSSALGCWAFCRTWSTSAEQQDSIAKTLSITESWGHMTCGQLWPDSEKLQIIMKSIPP